MHRVDPAEAGADDDDVEICHCALLQWNSQLTVNRRKTGGQCPSRTSRGMPFGASPQLSRTLHGASHSARTRDTLEPCPLCPNPPLRGPWGICEGRRGASGGFGVRFGVLFVGWHRGSLDRFEALVQRLPGGGEASGGG